MEGEERVNCFECAHFYITWDRDFPRGCRAHSFKGRRMPSAEVFESSGMECQSFEPGGKGGRGGPSGALKP